MKVHPRYRHYARGGISPSDIPSTFDGSIPTDMAVSSFNPNTYAPSSAGIRGSQQAFVDQNTGFSPAGSARLASDTLTLNGYSVTAATLP